MRSKSRKLAHGALIAALYVVLTHFQNILLPNSASFAIQCRLSEALCVLALFTPAAVGGLTVGCLLFNLSFAAALPLDWFVGALATFCATFAMRTAKDIRTFGFPLLSLLMPSLFNALFVGWELEFYIGGGFWLNALYVAIGEAIVLLSCGTVLFRVLERRSLARRLFGEA